ncbi:PilZ domain-containing protein [Lachnospiraceae bacterium 50-23]
MVLSNCTVCSVCGSDSSTQKRIRVQCVGDRIILYLKRENELSGSEKVRIDFYDEQIGCIKADCELIIRKNNDLSDQEPWIADCEILEVVEIAQSRRNLRAKVANEITLTSFRQGDFEGDIQNISVDGLYFITKTRLECDDTIEFCYTFVEREYRLKAIVLREENFRDGRYGYGCQITEFPQEAKRDVQLYIFKRQQGRIW